MSHRTKVRFMLLTMFLNLCYSLFWMTDPAVASTSSTTVTRSPVADAYVQQASASTNYGAAASLLVKGESGTNNRKTYLKFDLHGLQFASSVKLRVYGSNVQSTAQVPVYLYLAEDGWDESLVNWSNAPLKSSGELGNATVNNVAKYYEFDVTAVVREQLTGDRIVTFLLECKPTGNNTLSFNSKENMANPPRLIVDETPAAPFWTPGSSLSFPQVTNTSVTVQWPPAKDPAGVTEYRVYQDNVLVGTVNGSVYSYQAANLTKNQTYAFKVEAGNAAGLWSTNGPSGSVTARNPLKTLLPKADAYVHQASSTTNFGTASTLLVKGESGSNNRKAYIRFDLSGLQYASSIKLRVFGSNIQSTDEVPVYLYLTGDAWNEAQIAWNGAPVKIGGELGSAAVNHIAKYHEFDVTDIVQKELVGDRLVTFLLECKSTGGNTLSFNSRENNVNPPQLVIDEEPSAPFWTPDSELMVPRVEDTSVSLEWPPAKDLVGVTGYRIYRNGVLADTVSGTVYSYQAANLTKNQSYTFKIEAGNGAGLWSASGPTVTVIANAPPSWSAKSKLHVKDQSGTAITLKWSEADRHLQNEFRRDLSKRDGGEPSGLNPPDPITGYKLFKDGTAIATLDAATRTYEVTGLNSATSYSFKVEATDGVNWSTNGPSVTASTAIVPVTGVTVSKPLLNMGLGAAEQLTATVIPEQSTDTFVMWSSSNPQVAAVTPDGLIQAVGLGSATVTVTTNDGGYTAQSLVNVETPTIALNKNVAYQTIDGFGAAANHQVDYLKDPNNYSTAAQNEILDFLFHTGGDGIGLSMVRLEVNPFQKTDSNPLRVLQATFEPQEGVFDWETDAHQKWFAHKAMERGMNRFMSVPWEMPDWMTAVSVVDGDKTLDASKLNQFADYFKQYVLHYANQDGINIGWLSIKNEPDLKNNGSYTYTVPLFNQALYSVQGRFKTDRIWTRLLAPEGSTFQDSYSYWESMDQEMRDHLHVAAYHAYSGIRTTALGGLNKPFWQTEVSSTNTNDATITDGLRWAKQIEESMNIGDSAYFYWWAVAKNDNSGQHLVNLVQGSPWTYSVPKRTYALGQFSKFVRPGFERIQYTATNNQVRHVSFRDPATNKAVLVVINDSGASYTPLISGLSPTGNAKVYRTSATENMAFIGSQTIINGSLSYTFPDKSITTIVEDINDQVAPAAINNLIAENTHDGVVLSWTAPGDDSANKGTAGKYELRYSKNPITAANFASAALFAGAPAPLKAGTAQSQMITGLDPGTTYYFAMKTFDEEQNGSSLSNMAQVTTAASGTDTQTPTTPQFLSVATKTQNSVTLQWTAATDNVAVTSYEIYDGSTLVGSASSTSHTITGLTPHSSHVYKVVAKDAAGNASPASNKAAVVASNEVTLSASGDAYVRSGSYGNTPYGANDSYFLVVKGSGNPEFARKAYIKFDLTGMQSPSKATLRLFGANSEWGHYGSITANLKSADSTAWDESTLTWNNAPTISSSTADTLEIGKAYAYYEFDVTAEIQQKLQSGAQSIAFCLVSPDDLTIRIHSSENPEHPPQLVLVSN